MNWHISNRKSTVGSTMDDFVDYGNLFNATMKFLTKQRSGNYGNYTKGVRTGKY